MVDKLQILEKLSKKLDEFHCNRKSLLKDNPDSVYIDNMSVAEFDIVIETLVELFKGSKNEW